VLLTNRDTSSHSVALALAQRQLGTCLLYDFDARDALQSSKSPAASGCNADGQYLEPLLAGLPAARR